MKFKNYEVDSSGHIIGKDKSNLDCTKISCKETSGHAYNIVSERKNNIELTYFQNPEDVKETGVEIYYYDPYTWDIKYSRMYRNVDLVPKKHRKWAEHMQSFHKTIFD